MPANHWLDPLARRVLQATGQLPPTPKSPRPAAAMPVNQEPAWTLDVNRATASEWRQLPGCSDDMVDLLVRLQQGGVQFSAADDLFRLLELPESLAALWTPHLCFHWYGDAPPQPIQAPIDLNSAAPVELRSLGWPEDRLQRLLHARRRQAFRNLADLQERLCLPATAIEALIGRVCFGERRAGPSLPPRG